MGKAVSKAWAAVVPGGSSASDGVPSGLKPRSSIPVEEELIPPNLDQLRKIVDGHGLKINLASFELKATIGKGNFGRVRLVRFKNGDGTPFALKILAKMKIANEWGGSISHAARAVLRETSILQAVENPFVVNVLRVFHNEKRVFILMEFVNGGEMFRLVHSSKGLNVELIRFWGAEIVLTIKHLHEKCVIYRDLKPENVLLDCAGHIKLIDFGLAKILEASNNYRTATCCGTLCYQAPEVILNKEYSFPVDWWGVGALIFEMGSGKAPFGTDNTFAIQQRILSTSVQWPGKDCPVRKHRGLASLVTQFLTHLPDKRLGSGPLEDLKDQQDTTTQNKQNILPVSRPEDPRPNSQQLPLPPNSPGPERIQYHRFFQTIHFESIRKRTVSPPYRPNVTAIDDITMFPTYGDSAEDSVPDLSKKDKQAWIHELNIPLTSKE